MQAFVNKLMELDVDERSSRMLGAMFEENYALKSLDISARVLQNWYENNLLTYQEVGSRKHHFDFIELIWLFIVTELRNIGLPIKIIERVKDQLMGEISISEFLLLLNKGEAFSILQILNYVDKKNIEVFKEWYTKCKKLEPVEPLEDVIPLKVTKFNDLFILLILMIEGDEKHVLSISSEGDVKVFSSSQIKDFSNDIGMDTRIVVPLHKFFIKYMTDYRNLGFLSEFGLFNKNEVELFEKVLRGDFKEIIITFRDGKMERITCKKEVKNAYYELISKIASNGYHDITLSTDNGKIMYMSDTEKVKMK
jgi:DNA-binding transcriptional MerR regulator